MGTTPLQTICKEFNDVLFESDLLCINCDSITRIASCAGNSESVTDLTMVSQFLAQKCRWDVFGHHDCDNYPFSILVAKETKPEECCYPDKWSLSNMTKQAEILWAKLDKGNAWCTAVEGTGGEQPPWWILKQTKDEKVTQFQTIANEVKTGGWQKFCERVPTEKSFKLFWWWHKMMNCQIKKEYP